MGRISPPPLPPVPMPPSLKPFALIVLILGGVILFVRSRPPSQQPAAASGPAAAPAASVTAATTKTPSIILCDKCQKQEATVHVMQYVGQMRRTGKSAPAPTPPPSSSAAPPSPPSAPTQINLCAACANAAGVSPASK